MIPQRNHSLTVSIHLTNKRKLKIKTIIFLFVILFISCKPQPNKIENVTNSKMKIVKSEHIPDNLKKWADDINNDNTNSLKNSYDTNAIKIISEDSIIDNSAQIANYYRIQTGKITSIESIFNLEANKKKEINYQLVRYQIDNLKEFIGIVIWKMENGKIIREFEFTQETTLESKKVDTTDIDERRKLWIELCNKNNSENLVKQLYSKHTMYFNHKPIVKGTEELIKEYSYMNNGNYTLNLHPLKLEVVNANFVFEVGQCSGSYNGKYILVWKKQPDGNWKVYIDSNI